MEADSVVPVVAEAASPASDASAATGPGACVSWALSDAATAESGAAVAAAALEAYARLPRRGALQPREWSELAAVVATGPPTAGDGGMHNRIGGGGSAARVVALATGNKCVGRRAVRADGSVLVDCHAEVLARRTLVWCVVHAVTHCTCPSSFHLIACAQGAAARGGRVRRRGGPTARASRGGPLRAAAGLRAAPVRCIRECIFFCSRRIRECVFGFVSAARRACGHRWSRRAALNHSWCPARRVGT